MAHFPGRVSQATADVCMYTLQQKNQPVERLVFCWTPVSLARLYPNATQYKPHAYKDDGHTQQETDTHHD